MITQEFIAIRMSQIEYFNNTPLYRLNDAGLYTLYKPSGVPLTQLRIEEGRHPQLFFHHKDRLGAISEIRREFHRRLDESIRGGNISDVKTTICTLVEETLEERSILGVLPSTVNQVVDGYSGKPHLLRTLAHISFKDYSTVIHSVNVMALTIGFCARCGYTRQKINLFGLGGLLHDIGKLEIPDEILKAPRQLTALEFEQMKRHPLIGGQIVVGDDLVNHPIVLRAVLEHHERLDGSGYPRGSRKIAQVAQLIAIIDCYEALTNEDRPYRRALSPFEALRIMKTDVDRGRFNGELFKQFCYSLKTH